MSAPASPWWQRGVVYHVYPRSFLDTDGDGVGDLEGVRRGLDHLAWLGVDAVWLSPFYRSPMADFGYDVSDHCDVDPRFGTLGDVDRLVAGAHDRGIRLLVDLVPNHTSDQHPWFRDPAKHDWYLWRDGTPARPPNNWRAAFGDYPAWTWDDARGQWYLHLFLPQQPDLNWANPEVREAMYDVMRFWLDRGVDGFRIDVVQGLGKDEGLPDDPVDIAHLPHCAINDSERTHPILCGMREVVDAYPGNRVLVGEVYLLDTRKVVRYFGEGDQLHLAFNFPPLYARWSASSWRTQVAVAEAEHNAVGAWPTWVLSNHDNPRHRTRYGGGEARTRAAAVLLLTLRGTPFVYQGEELGLDDAVVPSDRVVDPGGRDGCRAPLPWDGSPAHGWPVVDPWLPWPPDADRRNVAALRDDAGSIVHLYRRLLAARRASPALQVGTWCDVPTEAPDVLAYERAAGDDRRVVLVNFGDRPQPVPLDGAWTVEVSSALGTGTAAAHEGRPYDGSLASDAALVLRPSTGS